VKEMIESYVNSLLPRRSGLFDMFLELDDASSCLLVEFQLSYSCLSNRGFRSGELDDYKNSPRPFTLFDINATWIA